MDITPSTALLIGGAVLLVVYFPLFARTMKALPAEELDRFIKQGSRVQALVALALILLTALVQTFSLRAGLAVTALVVLLVASRAQHVRLRQAGFDPFFVARLQRVSLVAGLAITLFLGGLVVAAYVPSARAS